VSTRQTCGGRVYRLLLRGLPAHLRHRHGDEMRELFACELEHARGRGRVAMMSAWFAALADLASAWPRELRRRLRQRGRVGIPREGRPIMLGSDIRYAFRSLSRQKFATGLVVGMLALGIAANVAVFSLVNGLFFRPFPFDEPDRLVFINEKAPKWNLDVTGVNFPDFDHWRNGQQAFESMAAWTIRNLNFADGTNADRISAAVVSHEFADVLRIRPLLGRMFTADEDKPGGTPVTLISHALWREHFAGDPNVLGRTLKLTGRPHTVIGVLSPESDAYPGGTRLWIPLQGNSAQEGQSYSYNVVARLKAGVTPEQGEQDLLRVHQPIFDTRDKERVVSPFVLPLREINVRDYRAAATTLTVAVGLLLLVACANVAAVMLARALSRRREMGIRVAVGANRMRLVRQLFVENFLLATLGGVLGLLLGQWAIRALVESLPDGAPPWATFGVDFRVMAFAVISSVLTVLFFGWAPALHAVGGDLRSAMHNVANAAITAQGGRRTLRVIIGTEFALATLLLVCGGLLFRAYDRVRDVDPGFTPQGVLTFTLSLPNATYPDDAARLAFWDRVEARMAQIAGARTVGLVNCPPFGCHAGSLYIAEGQAPRGANDANPVVVNRVATPSYFPTMGVRLKTGRFFAPADGRGGPNTEPVVLINETFAKTFFPGVEDPVGRRIRSTGENAPWNRVVGYVQDVKHYGLERPMRPGVYWPLPARTWGTMAVAVKTDGDPEALTASARAAVRELDPELPLFNVRTMEAALSRTLAMRTTYSWMLAVFALTALILALGGTYGVSSYLVTQRTREIGIRVALGAGRADIVRGVLRTSLMVASAGIVVGVIASLGAARLLESLLFGVAPHDAVILSSVVTVLVAAAVLANLLPARRAARVDPMTSLRAD
jgi:predicted permease